MDWLIDVVEDFDMSIRSVFLAVEFAGRFFQVCFFFPFVAFFLARLVVLPLVQSSLC